MQDDARDPIAFPRFFDPVELGRSLREVATDVIATTHHDVISRWFHSNKDADLFLWFERESGELIKQQLNFYGQVVEWNCVEGLRTGLLIETGSKPTETVRFDTKAQLGPVRQAMQLVKHVEALAEKDRASVIDHFRDPTLRRPGVEIPLARPRMAQSWWSRVKAFLARR